MADDGLLVTEGVRARLLPVIDALRSARPHVDGANVKLGGYWVTGQELSTAIQVLKAVASLRLEEKP